MQKNIAYLFSYVFHPLIIPTWIFLVLFNTNTYLYYMQAVHKQAIISLTFITTCLLPITALPLFLNLRLIKSLKIENTQERFVPILFTLCSYLFGFYLLNQLPFPMPGIFKYFILSAGLAILGAMLISLFWKISLYMIAIGGAFAAFLALSFRLSDDFFSLISLIAIFAGIIGFSRLRLNAHTPAQVFFGFLWGLASVLLFLMMFGQV
ncbi:MAG: hypothetical protein CSA05_00580 [Bacteroidia bacterium]|nr:MAG: hypothetical protein CSB01_00130 [Bacteroidia bacterium]PIE86443.1 MAG: hypothetical protein CSA05_00580 [Bacteroidia bacterium]